MDCSLPGSPVHEISQARNLLPPAADLPDPRVEPVSLVLAGRFFTTQPPRLSEEMILKVRSGGELANHTKSSFQSEGQ